MTYDFKSIELKWQKVWEEQNLYATQNGGEKEKFYALFEFPYPSGAGLHVGHCRPYTAMDIIARKKRMEGKNVLFPIGYDAFGLPTENYAIQNHIHPRIVTEQNIATFRSQLKALGYSFDWDREINTTDPQYFKWTQWIFLQMFQHGLAYKAKMPVNWCTSCKCVLANEEVVEGVCERCGAPVVRKEKSQWMLRITKYADRLIEQFDVRSGQGAVTIARSMSGGNQQKAIIAREVDRDKPLIIAVQPTRGLDVGAIEYIHKQLVAQRDAGKAVLLVSLELDEVMSLSDRILVMYEGQIVGELDPKQTTVQELGLYMSGAKRSGKDGESA